MRNIKYIDFGEKSELLTIGTFSFTRTPIKSFIIPTKNTN